MMKKIDDSFLLSLQEATLWCNHLVKYALPLWTDQLRPEMYPIEFDQSNMAMRFEAAVKQVDASRRDALASVDLGPPSSADEVREGAFLLYAPHLNLADGAARFESRDFFDDDNLPPWDCWVEWIKNDKFPDERMNWNWGSEYLICWTPEGTLDRVRRGLRVNPEECIIEAAGVQSEFLDALREEGLLTHRT